MAKNQFRTAGNKNLRGKNSIPLVKKIKKAVVYVTIGLIILFFYEAYFS